MTVPPFDAAAFTAGPLTLRAIDPEEAEGLAGRIAEIDPWRRLGYSAGQLTRYLSTAEDGARRLALTDAGGTVGALVIRHPWLRGPYIELLAVLPEAQGRGLGGAVIDWASTLAADRDRNLWVAASEGNDRALAFYRRHGFAAIGRLDDLVRDGDCEILLRKRLR